MKKVILSSLVMMLLCLGASAQNAYMVVNSEKIFKAIPAYVAAQSTIETFSAQCQKNVDDAYTAIEKSYNDYMAQKPYMSESARKAKEDAIITQEKAAAKRQQDYFGPEGEIIKRREALLKPIQEKVAATIKQYAQLNKYTLVLDEAAVQSVLFASPAIDKSNEIIKLVK